jgi:predicted XRE-type DNA-binding protein
VKRIAHKDIFIEELVRSPHYRVDEEGAVWTTINRGGWPTDVWRRADLVEKHGYKGVSFKHQKLAAHRVVYRALKGELDARLVVNHIDGNKQNNHPDNLELITNSANNLHAQKFHGGFGRTKEHPYHLRAALVRALKELGVSQNEIARTLGLTKSFISQVCTGFVFPEDKCMVNAQDLVTMLRRLK